MTINRKILESFSDGDVKIAASFLENIYLHNHTNLDLNSDLDSTIFAKLIQASSNNSMKYRLFVSLSVISQKKCFANLIYSDQFILLTNIKNSQLLISLFLTLEKSLQHEFLTSCFKTHISIFNTIKKALKPSFKMNHGLIVEQAKISSQQKLSYQKTLLSYLQDPSFSIQDVNSFVDSLKETLEDDDLGNFVENLFTEFGKLKLPLSSKESFASYLKFFNIAVSLVVMYPSHSLLLDAIIDHFLLSLDTIQSDSWILKILEQLPIYILKKCCISISLYEKIKHNKKRNLFMKYYKLIHAHINSVSTGNLKEAMAQV
tara:strand:- start:791 stop:1741 length:951 start_codon:yes stop_codon:yes gene_type:complete